jgi:hypothetical protein
MSAVRQETSGLGGEPPEATRFIKAQAGCIESLNQLMARHDGLVQAVVRQQVLGGLPFEEALQAGRIGLWRASAGHNCAARVTTRATRAPGRPRGRATKCPPGVVTGPTI